jgi:hypothetical protein
MIVPNGPRLEWSAVMTMENPLALRARREDRAERESEAPRGHYQLGAQEK